MTRPPMPIAARLRRGLSTVFAATALGGATAIVLTASSAQTAAGTQSPAPVATSTVTAVPAATGPLPGPVATTAR